MIRATGTPRIASKALILAFLSIDPDSAPKLAGSLYEYVSNAAGIHEKVIREAKTELTTAKKLFNWQGLAPAEDGTFTVDEKGNKKPAMTRRWFCSIHPKKYFDDKAQPAL